MVIRIKCRLIKKSNLYFQLRFQIQIDAFIRTKKFFRKDSLNKLFSLIQTNEK